ncbi:hypothetical protein CERZMDRAFT_87554 [Cercospora zeae-maydis SCOH1-5]|uniref:Uncharacterized protein n=1 Tax=Cercospora zeae-maydis SCOH1-5 TaxID=717836 RepID=A0A6A6F861_9PEZI|nr:hypothetical protein CERZMDRAFT_87554 [Cercospora zeae-maydis SCOH1-5]
MPTQSSSGMAPNDFWYYSRSTPGSPGPAWSQYVSYQSSSSTTTTNPASISSNPENNFVNLLDNFSPSIHQQFPSGNFPSQPQPQSHPPPFPAFNVSAGSAAEEGGSRVYPLSAAAAAAPSSRVPAATATASATPSLASGSRVGRNAAPSIAPSHHRSSASRSVHVGQSAFSEAGESLTPPLSSHGGGSGLASASASVAGSRASRGPDSNPVVGAGAGAASHHHQTSGRDPRGDPAIGFGPGGFAMRYLGY